MHGIATIITLATLSLSTLAMQHPSCINSDKNSTLSALKKPTKQKAKINFSNRKILKQQTQEHRNNLYKILIDNKVPKNIAKYVYKLNFLKKPTIKYKNQPEFKLKIDSYAKIFLRKIPNAQKFLQNNIDTLNAVEKKYSVNKESIVALILMESNLGKNKGKMNVFDALFTMSHKYTSSRTKFFTNELVSAFKLLASKNYFFRNNAMGSWAGAVGYVQFIPSSILAYAVDGNGDGIIDIINNKDDAIHSAGNYLKNAKWQYNKPIMQEISKPEGDICSMINKPYQGGKLFLAELDNERYFIVHNNHNTLLRWNRSFLFSYSVHSLSNKLKEK